MGWTWKYSIAVIVLGPIGGVMVWERIRREGVPDAGTAPHPPEPAERRSARSESPLAPRCRDDIPSNSDSRRATWVIRPG